MNNFMQIVWARYVEKIVEKWLTLKLYDHLCYFICAQINANGDNERNNIDDDNAESEVDASRSGSASQVSSLHYLW